MNPRQGNSRSLCILNFFFILLHCLTSQGTELLKNTVSTISHLSKEILGLLLITTVECPSPQILSIGKYCECLQAA